MNAGFKKSVRKVFRPLSKLIHGRDLVCLSDGYYFLVRFAEGAQLPSPALLGNPHFRLVLMKDFSFRGRLYSVLQDELYQFEEVFFPHQVHVEIDSWKGETRRRVKMAVPAIPDRAKTRKVG